MHARRRLSTFLLLALAAAAVGARAAVVEERTALAAAGAFVSSDAVGRTILAGRTVESAEARGRLWIVRLSPAGHVIVAGSDRADPVVGFSKDDFAEPDPASPAFAFFAAGDEAMDALDADPSAERHPRWDVLLGGGARRGSGAKSADPPAQAVVVEPFLESHWNQWQPYNDYDPVYDATEDDDVYRGRDPCGCVATAAAQVFRHFRWPAFAGEPRTVDHVWEDEVSSNGTFTVRFDGREPMDWDAMHDDYVDFPAHAYGSDLRGEVAESVRHPIARLVLWADTLARMKFEGEGSSGNYDTVAGNASEWYFPGEPLTPDGDLSAAVDCLRRGIPCPVELVGHQVVGHGWAEDGASRYLFINFGWGGSNDGWYDISDSVVGMPIWTVLAGHFPRAKPQVDPLTAVTDSSMTLSWHFPDIHTNSLEGFLVRVDDADDELSTLTETFSDPRGTIAGESVKIGENGNNGYDGPCLSFAPFKSGSFTLADTVVLTAASVVSFKVRSYFAQTSSLKLLAQFDGGGWEPVATVPLPDTGRTDWKTVSVYLGDRGGNTARLRIANETTGGTYYPSGWILVDNVRATEIFAMREALQFPTGPEARVFEFPDGLFIPGSRHSATVTPVLSADAFAPAETSDPVSWFVAGTGVVPVPGEVFYGQTTLSYSKSNMGDVWSVTGTQVDDTSVLGRSSASIKADLPNALSASSVLSFSWKAKGYYGNGAADTFTAVFTGEDGTPTNIWTMANAADQETAQPVSLSLAAFAGKTGSVAIKFSHTGGQYTDDDVGGTIIAPKITGVMKAIVPPATFETVAKTALGMPEILAVETAHGTDMQEGFYRECSREGTVLYVTCSPTVTALRALPSHLTFVPDSAVTVHSLGGGEFAVEIDGSGVTADVDRTRMILTLEAADANGTTVCKDLSLRFSSASGTASEDSWAVEVGGDRVADGTSWTADLPYVWLVRNGLAPKGATDAVFAAAANADADADGLANWGEWICGTAPTNAAEHLRALLEMDGGVPVLDYAPHALRDGFVPVFVGTETLSPAAWGPFDLDRHRFFRVRIEKP